MTCIVGNKGPIKADSKYPVRDLQAETSHTLEELMFYPIRRKTQTRCDEQVKS